MASGGRFATTRWSLVLAAADSNTLSAEALSDLCELYWSPVYGFVRRRGYSPDAAADLTQEFFARLIEKRTLGVATPERGRFRGFLCTSVRNFLSNERERAATVKRGGRQAHVSIEWDQAERQFQLEPSTDVTPESLFDRQWALVLLDRAMSRLGDEYGAQGRRDQFVALRPYLTGDSDGLGYRDAAEQLHTSEGALKVAVHRMRRRFRDTLLDEIAQTVDSADEVESELGHLFATLRE